MLDETMLDEIIVDATRLNRAIVDRAMLERATLDGTLFSTPDRIAGPIAEAEIATTALVTPELATPELATELATELANEPIMAEVTPPPPAPEQPFLREPLLEPVPEPLPGEPLPSDAPLLDLPPHSPSPSLPSSSSPSLDSPSLEPASIPPEATESAPLPVRSPVSPSASPGTSPSPARGSTPSLVEAASLGDNPSQRPSVLTQPWQPRTTWVVIHGWNSDPETFIPTAKAIQRARGDQETVLLLDWRDAAQKGGDGLGGLQSGGNFKAARSVASVADWAAQTLKDWGISDGEAQTQLNFVGHSLGAYVSAEIASRFEGGVNSIFALDPASEFNTVTGFGYDFDNDGDTERPQRFDEVARLSRSFVGARSPAGNQTVSGWAHESYEMAFGLDLLRPPGSEHRWVYETFANFIDEDNAIANQIGVKNLALVPGWAKDGFRRRHEGRLVVNERSLAVERLIVKSSEPGRDETVYGSQRRDNLFGGWGRDSLFGGEGGDRLEGGQGNDILVGGPGRDQLWGGGGLDQFNFALEDVSATIDQADTIHDFFTGNRFRSAETIGLGAGLSLEEIALETGTGDYAGDTLIRHGDKFLARLVGVGVGEISIAKNFTQLTQP